VRWRAGASLAFTNDAQVVLAISAANPAVVQTTTAHGWVTGNTVMFQKLGGGTPRLQNRQFTITKTDNTHFSLQVAITGANIDGSALGTGALVAGATVSRVQELTTPYVTQQWKTAGGAGRDDGGAPADGERAADHAGHDAAQW
jgi:hypothetical protein